MEFESVQRLSKDLKKATVTMDAQEARYLVDSYYQMQDNRMRAAGQIRAMKDEPHTTLAFFEGQNETLEGQIKRALDEYSMSTEAGRWLRSVVGIGPVIAAGLMAHIDITKCPTAGHIWAFAGLDPTRKWEKGQRRPHNAALKTLCWKIGESFVKIKGKEDGVYGHLYDQRKAYEQAKNLAGDYKDQAAAMLANKKFRDDTKAKAAYEKGLLPDGHIHARAKRWAVKIFLSHYHQIAYKLHYGIDPPMPYAQSILGHAHIIQPRVAA